MLIAGLPAIAPARIFPSVLSFLVRSRRRKLHITRFRASSKARSFRCSSSSHKIYDFAGALLWRHFPKGHTPCSRSFNFQGSVSPDKTHFTEKTGPLPYVQNDGKRLKISIFPRLWNHGIMVKNGRIFLVREGILDAHEAIYPGTVKRLAGSG